MYMTKFLYLLPIEQVRKYSEKKMKLQRERKKKKVYRVGYTSSESSSDENDSSNPKQRKGRKKSSKRKSKSAKLSSKSSMVEYSEESEHEKSSASCREWKKSIKNKNLLQNGDTFLHIAAKTGETEIFNSIFETEIVKNPKNYLSEEG